MKNYKMRTTSLLVDIDTIKTLWTNLAIPMKVITYDFPNYYAFSKTNKNAYSQLINAYKEALDFPFYFFSHGYPSAKFYVLVPKGHTAKSIAFENLDYTASPKEVFLSDLKPHIIFKLLVANYFYGKYEKEHRITQANFFIGAKLFKNKNTALELKFNHVKEKVGTWEEFSIAPHASDLIKLTEKPKDEYSHKFNYFQPLIKGNILYFRKVKPSQVNEFFKDKKKSLWGQKKKNRLKRPSLDWFISGKDEKKFKISRSFIIYQFQEDFCNSLNALFKEDIAKVKVHQGFKKIEKFKMPETKGVSETGLPVRRMKKVWVYDNRMKDPSSDKLLNPIDFSVFVDKLKGTKIAKELIFEEVQDLDQLEDGSCVFIIQDVNQEAFYERENSVGLLKALNFEDPKQILYDKYPRLVKQSLSINPLEIKETFDEGNWRKYFSYLEETSILKMEANTLNVCINELFTKWLIQTNKSLRTENPVDRFPTFQVGPKLHKYWYVHKSHLLFIDEEFKINIIDFRTPEGKADRDKLFASWGMDWYEDVEESFRNRIKYNSKDIQSKVDKSIETAHIVISKGAVTEIIKLGERVLPRYDKMNLSEGVDRKKETIFGLAGVHFKKEGYIYTVGSSSAIGMKEEKSVSLRRFHSHKGEMDLNPLLDSLTVPFVKNKQFTVYPFPFDWLRLAIELVKPSN